MSFFTRSLCAAALSIAASTASAATTFSAALNGAQEAPPAVTGAFGAASLILNDAMDALSISLSVTGIALSDFQGGHIHRAPAGANGSVVFGFRGPIGPDNDLDGDTVITATADGFTVETVWDGLEGAGTTLGAELANLFAGGLYINIHTTNFASGEIRGQIAPVPLPAGFALAVAGLGAFAVVRRRSA